MCACVCHLCACHHCIRLFIPSHPSLLSLRRVPNFAMNFEKCDAAQKAKLLEVLGP